MKVRALFAAIALLVAGLVLAGATKPLPKRSAVPWSFHSDFAHGLTGWMSFPLAQDIGYDPTLYTAREGGRTVLIRRVRALGQMRISMGVIRPLKFTAGPGTRIHFEFSSKVQGEFAGLRFILAGENGRRYSAPLPREQGRHAVSISAAQLRLPSAGIKVQAVVLLAKIDHPARGRMQRLTISDFTIQARHQPKVAVVRPALDCSEVGGECVSRRVLSRSSLLSLEVSNSGLPTTLQVVNPVGKTVRETKFPSTAGAKVRVPLGAHVTPGLWTAKLSRGQARTNFKFLVIGVAPPHPRILLSEKRLEQLRTFPQYAEVRAQIHRRARTLAAQIAYNPAAGGNIAHLPVGTSLVPEFVGELKSYFKLLESYANAISYCALDYSLNGNRKSLESARRALVAVARWKTWTPPRFAHHGMHTYYEVGVFAQRVALGYDLIAPQLSDKEKEAVANAFWKQIIVPTVDEYFLYNRMPTFASNWMANSLGGAIAAAVADEGDVPEWKSREGVALAQLEAVFEHLLKGLFPGDGSEVEPAGYENFAMRGISWGEAALHSLGIRPQGTERMWQGFWWPDYAMVRPDLVLDTGDFDGNLEKTSGFGWGAEHAGIPALRNFYDRSSARLSFSSEPQLHHTGRKIEDEAGPLDLACCTSPPKSYAKPPPSRIFPDRGSAVLRSGWSPQSTVISLRAGPWFNHEHHDEGSFQVAAFGEKLVSEAGFSAYYNDPEYPVYFSQAPGHNTVLIDDNPFSQVAYNGTFWRAFDHYPHFTSHLLSTAFDYLSENLTSAYAGRLKGYQRDFVFLPPDFLVVYDHIAASAPHVYTWLLHAPVGADLATKGSRATIQTPTASAALLSVDGASEWKIKSTPISIIKYDDLDRGKIHTPREFYLDSSRGRMARFLVGLHFSRGRAAGRAVLMRPFSSAAGEGIRRNGRVPSGIVFRTGPGALQLDGLATDGAMLAVRGNAAGRSWLAAGARVVKQGTTTLFRSEARINVAMERTSGGKALDLHLPSSTKVEVAFAKRPSIVKLDGAPVHVLFHAGMVVIEGVKKGNHRVSIDE